MKQTRIHYNPGKSLAWFKKMRYAAGGRRQNVDVLLLKREERKRRQGRRERGRSQQVEKAWGELRETALEQIATPTAKGALPVRGLYKELRGASTLGPTSCSPGTIRRWGCEKKRKGFCRNGRGRRL